MQAAMRSCVLLFLFVFVHRLGVPQCVPALSGSDSVCCVAGGSLWRLWLVSTQAGESTNTPPLSSCCQCLPFNVLSEAELRITNTGKFSCQTASGGSTSREIKLTLSPGAKAAFVGVCFTR